MWRWGDPDAWPDSAPCAPNQRRSLVRPCGLPSNPARWRAPNVPATPPPPRRLQRVCATGFGTRLVLGILARDYSGMENLLRSPCVARQPGHAGIGTCIATRCGSGPRQAIPAISGNTSDVTQYQRSQAIRYAVWQGAGWSFSATYGAERAGSGGSPEGDGRARRAVFGAVGRRTGHVERKAPPRALTHVRSAGSRQKHRQSSEALAIVRSTGSHKASASVNSASKREKKRTYLRRIKPRPKNENTPTELQKPASKKNRRIAIDSPAELLKNSVGR